MSRTPDGEGATPPTLEERLAADEDRIVHDEIRLAADEKRIDRNETGLRRAGILEILLGVILAMVVGALVISVIALNRDIDVVSRAAPRDDSVGTAALKDDAVTAGKLAGGAVTAAAIAARAVTTTAIAPRAVGTSALADRAVTGAKVAPDALTGALIREATLGTVPRANRAVTASDASALAGVAAGRYLSRVVAIHAVTQTSTLGAKGPVTASCPSGTQVISGGVAVAGARDVALTVSAPEGTSGWTAQAVALPSARAPWRIVVTAICARGG